MTKPADILIWPLLGLIWLYRLVLSPWVGWHCRFTPTCSCYASESLKKHGLLRGCALTAKRLLSCHPWGRSGHDPVP